MQLKVQTSESGERSWRTGYEGVGKGGRVRAYEVAERQDRVLEWRGFQAFVFTGEGGRTARGKEVPRVVA